MATLYPTWEQIDRINPQPTPGERKLLNFLYNELDDSFEIYFQPYLNGDMPDIIIMRRGYGVWIIEVKDWNLDSYYIKSENTWGLVNGSANILSPLGQVQNYKNSLYALHIEGLEELKINASKYYAIVSCAVYFHNEIEQRAINFVNEEQRKDVAYIDILGYDSLSSYRLERLLNKRGLNTPSILFSEELYRKFLRYLYPSDSITIKGAEITYNKKQIELSSSKPIYQKIKGVAGSGKSTVLAQRAVNAFKRTDTNILILTYNITLKNYLHDRISKVREGSPWSKFHIINYHHFFKSTCNNLNLIYSKDDFDNELFFDHVDTNHLKYAAILIDEIQDYKIEWQRLIRKNFLSPDGELVMFGDEKQNIYGRELEDQKVKTIIPGAWNVLNDSYRLSNKVSQITQIYQSYYFDNVYEQDIIQTSFDFESTDSDHIRYLYSNDFDSNHVTLLYSLFETLLIPPNDICFLATNTEILQKIDQFIRYNYREKTTTMFEKLEDNEKLKNNYDPLTFDKLINRIRRSKKANFWMNAGTTKLSTIHSFKGWEINTLILVLTNDNQNSQDISYEELIYTGLTRCKRNLIILNYGNERYHKFFEANKQFIDYFEYLV